MAIQTPLKTQIVIVGGGAAGLELAVKLGVRYGRKDHDIILVERNRTHIWKPLLHEVATGSLDANLDEVGYGGHGYQWGYRYFFGTLDGIDTATRTLHIAALHDDDGSELMSAQTLRYDYLVLAIGSISNDYNTPGVAEHCLSLDSRRQADRFRTKLLNHCLRVSRQMVQDPASDAHVKVAIVGGGATGVELAAELYNAADALSHYGLEVFDRKRLEVTLIEAGARILPALPEKLSDAARTELERLGVRVLTGMPVTEVTHDDIVIKGGERIPADLKVWAAGVKGTPIGGSTGGLDMTPNGQFVVAPTLLTSDPRVFAMGDCAFCKLPGQDRPVPPRAQSAHQMADTVFANLTRLMAGKPLQNFAYHDHGSLVSLSRFSTVGSLMGGLIGGQLAIEGRLARFVYTSLYRMHLIAIHGWLKGLALIVVGHVNAIVRPKLKLH